MTYLNMIIAPMYADTRYMTYLNMIMAPMYADKGSMTHQNIIMQPICHTLDTFPVPKSSIGRDFVLSVVSLRLALPSPDCTTNQPTNEPTKVAN